MRILIDILHPAHVHFFKHFYGEMTGRGHEICLTVRSKEISVELLESQGLPYRLISRQRVGAVGLALELVQRTYRLMRIMREFQPDVLTGIMGPSIALAGKLARTPAIVFYDTEFAVQTNWFVYPLARSVCTPDCYRGKVRGIHRTYAGYHELAYLHPNHFVPDPSKLGPFGVAEGEPFTIVRFVHWKAVHDRRERGLTAAQKHELVESLRRHGKVLLSSEGPLPEDLEPLRVRGPVHDIHHLLAHAQLIVGESATMSSEAAVLGVPAVMIATTGRGYTDDQEQRYGLVRHFTERQFAQAARAIDDLLTGEPPRDFGRRARKRLLADKIDVTRWMVNYFEETVG